MKDEIIFFASYIPCRDKLCVQSLWLPGDFQNIKSDLYLEKIIVTIDRIIFKLHHRPLLEIVFTWVITPLFSLVFRWIKHGAGSERALLVLTFRIVSRCCCRRRKLFQSVEVSVAGMGLTLPRRNTLISLSTWRNGR